VGLGVISKYYLPALANDPGVCLAAVCDLDPAALAPFRGQARGFSGHRDLLADADVDAVIVNVPNDAHVPVCRDAVEAGLPVCVEKPLATRVADGRDLLALARERGVPVFTAFHRRYNSEVRELLARLRQRGPVESVTVRYLERIEDHVGRDRWYLDPARCGGGCVADNGPNAFDLVRLLLGPVHLVDAGVRRDERGVDRQAVIELAADSGGRARVELDWSYDAGECKDITVSTADGAVDTADLLAGHPEFKSSLWHEYAGVVRDFTGVVRDRLPGWPDGLAELELVSAVYLTEQQRRPAGDAVGQR
jgi:predicted dehydrogenase